jgi:hypothetical protein
MINPYSSWRRAPAGVVLLAASQIAPESAKG